jgi:hypothetical protein
MKKTNDQEIKKWLEGTGVDWRLWRDFDSTFRWLNPLAKFLSNCKTVTDAMRKAGLL